MNNRTLPLVTPGEVLREEFILPMGITARQVAEATGIPAPRISEIVKGRARISAEFALRLAAYFGTSGEFWLNLQSNYDLERTRREIGQAIAAEVRPLETV
jgi:addiction module HigA family antidote